MTIADVAWHQLQPDARDIKNGRAVLAKAVANRESSDASALSAAKRRCNWPHATLGRQHACGVKPTVTETDPEHKTTTWGYDCAGRLESVTDALTHVTRYGYDEQDNRITQTDARTKVTRLGYDKMGREVKKTWPGGDTETKYFDIAGRLDHRIDALGRLTSYDYDDRDRVLGRHYLRNGVERASVPFTYTYTGLRQTATDARGVTTYGYDDRDRLTTGATAGARPG